MLFFISGTHIPAIERAVTSLFILEWRPFLFPEATATKRQAEREALVELAKTDEEAAKKLAEMRKYQSQATVRSYQKMKADAEAGDPDAIKRYETTLAKRREEYHRKKGA